VTPAEARLSPPWNRQPAVLCGMRGLEDVLRQGCICTALGGRLARGLCCAAALSASCLEPATSPP
jgi:hypothetical protein